MFRTASVVVTAFVLSSSAMLMTGCSSAATSTIAKKDPLPQPVVGGAQKLAEITAHAFSSHDSEDHASWYH